MSLATEPRAPGIPRPVLDVLTRVRRRLAAATVLRLVAVLALAASIGALVGIAADLAFVLPLWVRWTLWGAWVAGIGVVVLTGLVRLGFRLGLGSESWDDLAAVAERPYPDLDERLTSAVGLANRPSHGSITLIEAVQDDAGRRASTLDLRRSVPLKRPARWAVAGVLMLALVGIPAIVCPDPVGILLARFVAPWSGLDRIGRFTIEVEPGDVAVAPGADLDVSARVTARYGPPPTDDAVNLEWIDGLGKLHQTRMKADPSGFSAQVSRLATTIRYRVVASGSPSSRHVAEVIEPPSVASISARIEPPAYTNLPTDSIDDPARLEAWTNSRIRFQVRSDRPVRSLKIAWPDPDLPDQSVEADGDPSSDGKTWTIERIAQVSGPYRFLLEDDRGLRNRRDADRTIVVRPDSPPTVALLGPESRTEESARPDDRLVAEIAARDDLGLAILELHYTIQPADSRLPARPGLVPAAFEPERATIARVSASVDLRRLALQPGDTLAYRARAVDILPPPDGPHEAWSDTRTLTIATRAEPMAQRRSAESRAELQTELDALKKAAADNRRQTEPLRYAADAALRGNGRWDETRDRELAAREPAAADLADRLEQLARDLEADNRFAPLAEPARQIARVEAEAGRQALADAIRDDDPARRLADLQKADNRQAAIQARLDDLQKRFDDLARFDIDRQKLDDLAQRQRDLAQQAEALANQPAADRAQLDQLQAEQERLRRELAELLQRSPQLRAEALAQRAQEADELVARVRDLAARQRDEARATAEFRRDDPRFQALADAQRQIEDDARRLALDIDAPLLENGRGRLNTGLLANAVEPILRGDFEQSRQRLDEAEADLRRAARDLDELGTDRRTLARRLARRQDNLLGRVAETLRSVPKPPDNPDDRDDMVNRLSPLRDQQDAINRSLSAISTEDPAAVEALEQARQATHRAAEALANEPNPRQVENRHREAVQALNRLAETLPDPNQRREQIRQKLTEAHQKTEESVRVIDQALRETGPQPGKAHDPRQADADLAQRLEPIASRLQEAIAALESLPAESRLEPQRNRAHTRNQTLRDAVNRLREHIDNRDEAAEARRSLRPLAADARAAINRLAQKVHGRIPADDAAEALALEARTTGADARLVNALRNLDANDAPTLQAEAVRRAAEAAQAAEGEPGREARDRAADAVEALADRLHDRLPANREAAILAEAARHLDDQARQGTAGPRELAVRQRSIADASIRLNDREAEQSTRQSADLADRAAGLVRDGPDPSPIEQAHARSAAIQALDAVADRANDPAIPADPKLRLSPRAAAEALARRQRALADRSARDPNGLEPLQRELARALDDLPETRPEDDPIRQEADQHRQAARDAQKQAAEALAQADGPTAHNQATQAAESLERLAQTLPGAAGSDPPMPTDPTLNLGPAQAHDIRQLAQRERRLRESLQDLLGERVPSQEALRDRSVQLGREFDRLQNATRALSPRSHEPARQAADLLGNRAPRVMDQAAEALAQGRPDPARDTQRHAAELTEQAANRAEDLAAALRGDIPPGTGSARAANANASNRQGLAEAQAAQAQAAQELGQARESGQGQGQGQGKQAAQAASTAMKQAAEALQAAARTPGSDPSVAPVSQPDGNEPRPSAIGQTDADLNQLQKVLRAQTGRVWGELPGHLRTELLQMSQGRYRDDYARLIQLYFREIATASPSSSTHPNSNSNRPTAPRP